MDEQILDCLFEAYELVLDQLEQKKIAINDWQVIDAVVEAAREKKGDHPLSIANRSLERLGVDASTARLH